MGTADRSENADLFLPFKTRFHFKLSVRHGGGPLKSQRERVPLFSPTIKRNTIHPHTFTTATPDDNDTSHLASSVKDCDWSPLPSEMCKNWKKKKQNWKPLNFKKENQRFYDLMRRFNIKKFIATRTNHNCALSEFLKYRFDWVKNCDRNQTIDSQTGQHRENDLKLPMVALCNAEQMFTMTLH